VAEVEERGIADVVVVVVGLLGVRTSSSRSSTLKPCLVEFDEVEFDGARVVFGAIVVLNTFSGTKVTRVDSFVNVELTDNNERMSLW